VELGINRNITILEQDLIMNGQVFERVQNFRYLNAFINSRYLISDEIKSRIPAGNKCFYHLRQIFKSTAMSKAVKIQICKTMVKPIAVHGSETWTATEVDMKRLGTWDRRILRRIYEPMVEKGTRRIRTNQELSYIKIQT
jgi:predicted phosphohydrolase